MALYILNQLNRVEYRAAAHSNKMHREIRPPHWSDIFSAKFKLCYIIITLLITSKTNYFYYLFIYSNHYYYGFI